MKRKNYKPYHLLDKKTGNIIKYWIYGYSPSEIEKRLGKWDKRTRILIPVLKVEKYQSLKYKNRQH